jgi:predicted amidophosphoribosyltransferase
MTFLSSIPSLFLDFLFPKSENARNLESLSIERMIELFPASRPINDDNIISIFDYQNHSVKDLVWEIKYRCNKALIKKSADIIYEVLCHEIAERALSENFRNPLLIPMPISDKKRDERGFNQTEMICEELENLDSENLFVYRKDLLKKKRQTESQSHTHTKSKHI